MTTKKHPLLLKSTDRRYLARCMSDLPPRRTDLQRRPFRMKIIHINDFHNAVLRLDERGQWISPLPSLHSLLESRREELRREGNGTVFFISAGDEMVGTAWDYLVRDIQGEYRCHSAYHFLSLLGLDISVAGNHDFDNGCDRLRTAIERDASFPVISANVKDSPELADTIRPAAIFSITGVRIGMVGLTTMGQQRGTPTSRYRISSPLEAAREWIPVLRDHCDAVVVVSHLGSTVESKFAEVIEHGDLELTAALDECKPDLIIGGHTHELFQTISNGVPVTQVGCNGRWVGEIDLLITGRKNSVEFFPAAPLESDADAGEFYQAHITPFLERHLPSIRSIPLLADSGACPLGVHLSECKGYERCSIAGFLTDALLARLEAHDISVDFVLLDGSVVNDLLPTGDGVGVMDLFRLLPYADSVTTIKLTGEEVARLVGENKDRARISGEEYREKGFLYFSSNIGWEKDATGRVTNIQIADRKIERNDSFTAATTNYARALAVHWEKEHGRDLLPLPRDRAKDTGLFLREEIIQFFLRNKRDFAECHPATFTQHEEKESEGPR